MVMNAGEGRQWKSAIKGMVMPPVVVVVVGRGGGGGLARASGMRWCGLKKNGRLLGRDVSEVGVTG